MDPSEVAVMRARQGAVEASDFDDEPKYRHPKRRAKKARARSLTRTPCPEAEDGKHVYVWVPYISEYSYYNEDVFYKHYGWHKRETKTCCGCLATAGSRETERYLKTKDRRWRKLTGGEYEVKRGEPVPRWGRWAGYQNFVWENYDEDYYAKVKAADAARLARWRENFG
jgi:hypothetical protein